MKSPLIRPSDDNDLPVITRIYGYHVLTGTGTFETEPPSVQEMAARRADVQSKGLPWLVAQLDDGSSRGRPIAFRSRTPFTASAR